MLEEQLRNLRLPCLAAWARVVLPALAIQALGGFVFNLPAAATPHQYNGNIQFDVSKVPFSRYGSYIAFSHLGESSDSPEGLYLRILHGAIARKELFRVELLRGWNPVGFKEIATPTLLRLEAAEGYAEICIAEPKVVLMRGAGVGLRLAMPQPEKAFSFAAIYNHAFPYSPTQWEVNSFTQQIRFMLTALQGNLVVDAPWQGTRSERVVADFLPDPQTGKFSGALEEFPSVWQPHPYKSFDSSLQALQSEYRQWLSEMPAVPEEFSRAAELAAYVDWESVVAPEGHLTRPAMLMSKNWMTNIWSWDDCFNAMALFQGNPKLAMDQIKILFDNQSPQGAFPDYMNDQVVSWNYSKPPIHGWALRWMLAHGPSVDRETLAGIYEPLVRWTNWYFNYRDYDHDGIPEYDHGNDSGWDNSTIFMIRPPVEAPDLSAYLVVQMDVLSQIAGLLEKPEEAQGWEKRADDLLSKMLACCWKDNGFVAPQAVTHFTYPSQSLILYLPIVLGNRLPKPVLDRLVSGLKTKGRFLTENGLATESLESPHYEPDGYWLGPVWAPSTMVIAEGLDEIGEKEFAHDLRLRFCKLVAKSGISENFDAITGAGLRDPAYTWTSSVFLIFAHELWGEQQSGNPGVASESPAAAQNKGVFPSYYADKDEEPSADPQSPFWKGIQGVTIDKSILGPPMPQFRSQVRSRWTQDSIYFLFAGPYQKLTLKPNPDTTNETYRLWEKDCFEVYLGADFEHINRYREFQMSPQGEFLDLDIDSSRPHPGYNGEQAWDSGMKVKARIDPAKKFWYGEMRIPIAAVDPRVPRPGNEMRINLFRQDGEPPHRDFLAWQPTGVWMPHHPEEFGTLRLVKLP